MIVQCAWCLEMLGEKAPLQDTSISHGICEVCERKLKSQLKREIKLAGVMDEVIRKIA